MEHFYCTYFFNFDSIVAAYLANIYDVIQHYSMLVLNNCPFYYQMVYGYAPLTYILIRRKFRKNNYLNYFDKSNLNWLFFNIKLLSFRSTKMVVLLNFIEIFFKKIFFLMKFNLGNRFGHYFTFFIKFITTFFSRFV